MLNLMNSVGKATSLSQPWYLSGAYLLGDSEAAFAADFKGNLYAVNQTQQSFDDIFTFSRSSEQSFLDRSGTIQTAAIDVPALDKRGLATFQERKNFHPYSEDLSQWNGNTNVSKTLTSEVAPDGSTNSVYRFNRTSVSASFIQRNSLAKDNANVEEITGSVYVKQDDARYFSMRIQASGYSNRADLIVDLNDGSVETENSYGGIAGFSTFVQDAGNGWYRIGMTLTTTAASGLNFLVSFSDDGKTVDGTTAGSATAGGYVWGSQIELGNNATAYIQTNGSAATRAYPAMQVTGTNFTDWFNPPEFSFVYDFTPSVIKGSSQLLWQIEASDGRIFIELGNSGILSFGVQSDGATNFINMGTIEANKEYRLIVGLADGDITVQLSNGNIEYRTFNLPTTTSWDFAKTALKPDVYHGSLAYYGTRLPNGTLAAATDFILEGDSYAAGANGIGLRQSLLGDDYNIWSTAVGGSTLEDAVSRLEALVPKQTVILCDGSVNSHGTISQDIAKYQRAFDATGGNIVFISPVLYPSLYNNADGQFALDLTAAMLIQGWRVVDGTSIARTLSGVSFTDVTNAGDAGYNDVAYDALFQTDNVHPEQVLSDALMDAALV